MKTGALIIIYHLLMITCVKAQKDVEYFRGGLSFFIGGTNTGSDLITLPAFTLSPGFRIIRAKEFSLSAEFPISLGASDKSSEFHFGFDVPATLNLNFGYGSSNKSAAGFGISLGAGVGYHYSYYEYTDYSFNEHYYLSLPGFIVQSILSFKGGKKHPGDPGGGLRLSYMSNYSNSPVLKKVFGIGLIIPPF